MGKTIQLSIIIFVSIVCASGGYEHGTSTGKGKIQIDLTWNPFNYFEYGQTYIVIGYGFSHKIDFHGYYSSNPDKSKTYYYGIFYQFFNNQNLDLATAIGIRGLKSKEESQLFFPQLLYNIKLENNYTIGGSFVNIKKSLEFGEKDLGITFDIALFIPLSNYIRTPKYIDEIKFGLGFFNPVTHANSSPNKFLPTYSIDIKLDMSK